MSRFFTGPMHAGPKLEVPTAVQEHVLGTVVTDGLGNKFVYVQAGGSNLAVNDILQISAAFVATASGNAGRVDAVAHVAVTASYYAWVLISGQVTAITATGVTAGQFVSFICDASGDLKAVVAVAEAGTTAHAAGAQGIRGVFLTSVSGGLTTVRLF